ncbi:MAG: SLC13 family permease [Lachnospiraceae bacterium]|nr:SLC13 family permease [Lachnospiraceae bacterium]
MDKKKVGFLLGLLLAIICWIVPIPGLEGVGKKCLALTLMTVVWWAMQVTQSGYVGGLYLALLLAFGVAEPAVVFKSWTGPTFMLIIGAYLIASAVRKSGLGERIAYAFLTRFVKSYHGLVVAVFVLSAVMSLLIPNPWPRAMLLLSVVSAILACADVHAEDAMKAKFSIFVASVPVSMIFLTGDSTLNPMAVANSGMACSFFDWFLYMGIPAIAASVLTCALFLILFRPDGELHIRMDEVKERQKTMGTMSACEKRTAFWLMVAIVLWMTESVHGIGLGWVTLAVAMLMSFPLVGEVLDPSDWSQVPVNLLIFLTAAMAIGAVGGATGMNAWLAETLLPAAVPTNLFVFGLVVAGISMLIHMCLGSVVTVMGIAAPAFLSFTAGSALSPLAVSLMVYTACACHYILPFHHLNLLVGIGEENGGYTQKECIRMGLGMTAITFATVLCVEVPWWKLLGLF